MDRRLTIEPFFFGLCLSLGSCSIGLVGCGGSPESTTGTPTAESPNVNTAAGSNNDAQVPPSEKLKNGMTLPDEVPIEPSESPVSSDPNSEKGMQLPDDLAP